MGIKVDSMTEDSMTILGSQTRRMSSWRSPNGHGGGVVWGGGGACRNEGPKLWPKATPFFDDLEALGVKIQVVAI